MYRKLRSPVLGTEGIMGIVAISTFLVLLSLSFKIAMAFGALICLIAFSMTLLIMIRTRNMYFLPQLSGQFFATILLLTVAFVDVRSNPLLVIPLAGLMGISFTIMLIFIFQRRMKWRTRETLELAAQPLQEKTNGLTQRPMQAGTIDFNMEEIRGFTAFIRKNLIAIPVVEPNRVVFILNLPIGRLLSFSTKYDDRSWVCFDHEGRVTVNISHQDYFLYRDQWAFDQLCTSLGDLFISFLENYKNGSEELIIHRMNALNLNVITEG